MIGQRGSGSYTSLVSSSSNSAAPPPRPSPSPTPSSSSAYASLSYSSPGDSAPAFSSSSSQKYSSNNMSKPLRSTQIQPPEQGGRDIRSNSNINMSNFKNFNARRKWQEPPTRDP